MSGFTAIDLDKLPSPGVVEALDYEVILAAMQADLLDRGAALTQVELESEPITKLLEVCAYREFILRQRVNDGARAVMLAYAGGADLDQLGALFGVARQVADPGDATALPPIPPTLEDDSRYRQRVQLSLEGLSTAGPVGAYVFWSLSASVRVRDVAVQSPEPGEVVVTVLAEDNGGVADELLLATVNAALSDDSVRPLTDQVLVEAAAVVSYALVAELTFYAGPDQAVVQQAAIDALNAYALAHFRLGHDINLSGLYAALHQPGVQKVVISEPAADLVVNADQAALLDGVTVTAAGVDE